MMVMMMMMIMVNLWYSKILLEIGGTDYIAGFPENPTRCWGSQKCHHVPWWRNGRFHGNRRSYSQGSTTEQNRGGNCSVVGEIPQCGSIKGISVNVNHEPNYNDRFFPQCESYTRQEVRVILEICSKNLPSVLVIRMILFSSAGFLIYIIL